MRGSVAYSGGTSEVARTVAPPDKSVEDYARETIARAKSMNVDDVWEEALRIMLDEVHSNRRLRDELTEPLLRTAVWETITACGRQERTKYFHKPNPERVNIAEAMSVSLRSWYDYPLRSGRRLGDAMRPEVLAQAEHHDALAKANRARHLVFEVIAKRMDQDKCVRESLSENEIQQIADGVEAS